jgi:large subunit ribosomal protein L15
MPARFRKKVRRQRGSHTHGWGSKKKHRGSGSRGGKGKAGLFAQKKSYVIVHEPERYGSRGFKVPAAIKRKNVIRVINLKEVDALAEKKGLKEIDVSEFGYQKVLGSGKLSIPLIVKAEIITEKAKAKIEKAGGKAISANKEEGE